MADLFLGLCGQCPTDHMTMITCQNIETYADVRRGSIYLMPVIGKGGCDVVMGEWSLLC